MVTLAEKKRMRQFTGERLEAGKYTIIQELVKGLLVQDQNIQNQNIQGQNNIAAVHLFAGDQTKEEVRDYLRDYVNNGWRPAFVLYKDDRTACALLGKKAVNRAFHSLKKYNHNQHEAMINLRDLEKTVLKWQKPDRIVTYYQPKSERLPEGLRVYSLNDVILDRSHVTRGHPAYGFVQTEVSTDFKLPVEMPKFAVSAADPARLIFSPCYASIVR